MNRAEREWVALTPAWIREAREGTNATRTGLLDGPMLEACGDVTGRRILDSITAQQLEAYPELDDELRVPNFIVYVLEKP